MMKKGSFDDWIVFSALSLGIIWVILYIFLSRSSEKIKKDVDANDSSFSRYVDHSSIISSHDLLRQRQFHGNNNTQVLDHNILPRPIPQRPNFHSPPLVETPRIPVHQHFNEDDGNPIIPTTKNSRVTNEDKSFVSTKPFVGLRGSAALVTVNRLELLLQEANAQSTSQCLNHDDSSQNIKQSVSDHTTGVLHSLPNVSLTDLSLISVLGGGAFGQVWKGSWRGTPVAVKILHPALSSNSPITSSFQEEISLLSRLRHPNICLCLAASTDSSSPAIVTELATNGNLWEALRNPNAVPLYLCESSKRFHWPEKAIIKVIEGMCRGLVYLHLEGIVHRGTFIVLFLVHESQLRVFFFLFLSVDLKSANLLLDEGFNVKVS